MTCRDCKLWDIDAARDKAGHVRKDRPAKCLWVSKEQYPESIGSWKNRPTAHNMYADYGKNCKCFHKREK